jgi:ribonuclease R
MSTHTPDDFNDPMAAREAAKYEFPVPSREAVLAHLTSVGEPVSFKRLAEALGVEGERDLESFSRRLRAMERDGQVLKNRRGRYGLLQKMDMVRGRVIGHPEGFGFLVPDEGGGDLFLPPNEMRQLLHGDRAVARIMRIDARGRKEGTIIEVLERQQKQVVGRFLLENHIGFVVPDDRRINQDILIPKGEEGSAQAGQIVVAEITEPPTRHTQPIGRIAEVLGDHMAPGMEIEIALRKYDLPHVWPEAVMGESAGLSPTVAEEDKHGREDLRELPLVTIDGEDARDFDDAVYCERHGKGWRLVVAIADVAHYVRPGTALDQEAYGRGNSVYFPKNVIPMLPEVLSNGLCSLNPDVDRLCMACEIFIGPRGHLEDYRFFEGVMRSHARLTYNKVAAMVVDRSAAQRREYEPLLPHLDELYALYKVLHGARLRRGSVDFELPETRIIYNTERKIERIEPLERNDAHRLIEECMLAANVCTAEFLSGNEIPALYRVHAGPTPEKLTDLRNFLFELGLRLEGGDEPEAKHYAKVLSELEPGPEARLIQSMLLRSLSQATYSPDNLGHFALAYPNYTHFTSPIRRYPDLLIHRTLKKMLHKRPAAEFEPVGTLETQGEHCSMTERRADDATRDVIRWLKTEYMMDRIGEEFDGIVSGVTNFGLFVELADIYVDGLVHISALGNDYYHFDPAKQRLLGERTGQSYRLGDGVRVRLVRANLDDAKLDFEPAEPETVEAPKGAGRKSRSKRRRSRR